VSGIDRRTLLALGGSAVAAGILPAAAIAGTGRSSGIMFFEPGSAMARTIARQAHAARLVALEGDPVRLWRDTMDAQERAVSGITRWSDYLLLRDLATEHGLRIRREEHIRSTGQPMLVHWTAA